MTKRQDCTTDFGKNTGSRSQGNTVLIRNDKRLLRIWFNCFRRDSKYEKLILSYGNQILPWVLSTYVNESTSRRSILVFPQHPSGIQWQSYLRSINLLQMTSSNFGYGRTLIGDCRKWTWQHSGNTLWTKENSGTNYMEFLLTENRGMDQW
jgi:hypothetical protein